MAIRIKRSSGNTAPNLLESGQLAYVEGSTNGGTLYYGEIGGTVREIAGKKFVDKVNGIEAGAQVNAVTSVAGRTGAITLAVADVTNAESTANKGQANGYASLDSNGLVPSAQLPSYVDDVLEYNDLSSFPGTGVAGKIYVAQDTGKTYRWSGSTYVEISASPGSTDSVTEGSTNLYFTNSRARQAVSVTDSGGDGSLSYDNSTGVITYTGPSASDVRAHFSAGTGITISSGVVATTITQYTNSDARGAVSVTDSGGDGSLSYDSGTGVFTYTGPSASDVRAHFSGGTAISITNGVVAFTGTQATGNELENVEEDTTPSLGGDLDVNSHKIKSTSGGSILLESANAVAFQHANNSGVIVGNAAGNNSTAYLGSNENQDFTLIGDIVNGVGGAVTLKKGTNGNVEIYPAGTGKLKIGNLYFPNSDGSANQVLKTDGSGVLSWVSQTAGVTAFTGLSDVPASYSGAGGYYVKVNSGASALEFSQHIDDGTF